MSTWFRNTDIYRESIALVSLSKRVIDGLPRGHGFLADQLRRASSSVVLNFSEGCSRRSRTERARYFDIARGSAMEVLAALDVARALRAASDDLCAEGTDLADHLASMLYRFK